MGLKIIAKLTLLSRKSEWQTMSLKEVRSYFKSVDEDDFETGIKALYLSSRVYLSDKEYTNYFNFDVESPDAKGHSNISKNIQAAVDFCVFLAENHLTARLTVFATGNGFRFCWPFIVPLKYKKAFLFFIKATKCIDASPQTKNSFFRVLGYRNNSLQGKPLNRHIHKLKSPEELLKMTEEKYLKLTSGPPDYSENLEWIESGNFFPITDELPPEWVFFLEQQKIESDLKDSIFRYGLILKQNSPGDDKHKIDQIYKYLDDFGNTYTTIPYGNGWILRLNVCPICGQSGCAFVTSSGRLKCHHRKSCRAGVRDENDHIIGIGAKDWLPGYVEYDSPPTKHDSSYRTREEIRALVEEVVQKPGDKLIKADPGGGKTCSAVKGLIPMCSPKADRPKLIGYSGPTNELDNEVYEMARGLSEPETNVCQILSRNYENCRKFEKVERAAKLGYPASSLICPDCRDEFKGLTCQHDAQYENIEYGHGFVTFTHCKIKHANLDQYGFDILVIDESPLGAFFSKNVVELRDILQFNQAGYQGNFFEKIVVLIAKALASATPEDHAAGAHIRIYAGQPPQGTRWEDKPTLAIQADITEAEESRLGRHLAAYRRLDLESHTRWLQRIYSLGVNMHALNWLLCFLGEVDGVAYLKINLSKSDGEDPDLCSFVRTRIDLPKFSGPIICLDGTGTKQVCDAVFKSQNRDFQVIEGRLSLATCQKTLIRRGIGKVKAQNLIGNTKEIRHLLSTAFQSLRHTDNKILITTHMAIESIVVEIARELLPDRTVESIHYYGPRGINRYEDFDAVVAFGAPGPAQHAWLDEAVTLFPDSSDRKKWYQELADAELIQTIHRIRPVNGHKNIILIHSRWLPELGGLDFEIDLRRGGGKIHHSTQRAYDRLARFYKVYGFINIEMAYILKICYVDKKELITNLSKEPRISSLRCLIYNTIIDNVSRKNGVSDLELLLFNRPAFWTELCKRLQEEFPGQSYEKLVHSKWTSAYGSLAAAEEFSRMTGLLFNPENWRKKYDAGT